ncbi:MAG: hypothetical protein BWY05_00133 [Euryarchaeota archaeon ADurb.Bin165]|nr:MAG: hypothetical protein BWY05_00133 [Euryarchaeota archaeon ADurb.Bin165]
MSAPVFIGQVLIIFCARKEICEDGHFTLMIPSLWYKDRISEQLVQAILNPVGKSKLSAIIQKLCKKL